MPIMGVGQTAFILGLPGYSDVSSIAVDSARVRCLVRFGRRKLRAAQSIRLVVGRCVNGLVA